MSAINEIYLYTEHNDKIQLTRTCHYCDGKGEYLEDSWEDDKIVYNKRPCGNCNGIGIETTANGDALLRFLEEFR